MIFSLASFRTVTLTLAATSALFLGGCSSSSDNASGDPGEDDAVTDTAALSAGTCDQTNLSTPTCNFLAFGIQWNAPEGPRKTMIERGVHWVEMGVPYSKYHSTEGYRQDCSGSVSMEWELPQNPSTPWFAPFNGTYSYQLGSFDELQAGDALNRVNPRGHIVLFAQWGDDSHQSMFVLEEAAPGRLMQIRTMSRADAEQHYAPIRKNGL